MSVRGDSATRQVLVREALASGLYVAIVLVGAVVAVPTGSLPDDVEMAFLVLGSAVGLVLAHWFAFRLASHVAEAGYRSKADIQEGAAQLAGGVAVAAVAAVPFLVLTGSTARTTSLVLLLAMPGIAGAAVLRQRGRSWPASVVAGLLESGFAVLIVQIKLMLGH